MAVRKPELPNTLTDASHLSGIVFISVGLSGSFSSNSRLVPYRDFYRDQTGLIETPAEHLQRAAEDEARRVTEVGQ